MSNADTFKALVPGAAAALGWALAVPLTEMARPMPPLQVWALATFAAFLAARMAAFARGACPRWRPPSPTAMLGLATLGLWVLHGLTETSLWGVGRNAWTAAAILAVLPLGLSAWALSVLGSSPARPALVGLALIAAWAGAKLI